MQQEDRVILRWSTIAVLFLIVLAGSALYGCPMYRVYDDTMTGKAELARAESNRQIKTLEARAALESSKALAQAEVERARGVAEANRIIGDSLKGNEDYLRYLWIHNLEVAETKGSTIIYVPTEANLPILEASRPTTRPQVP